MKKTYMWVYLVVIMLTASMVVGCGGGGGGDNPAGVANIAILDPSVPINDREFVFGPTAAGTSTELTLTVANIGDADLDMGSITGSAPFGTTADNCSGKTVAPGGSCTFTAVFSPVSAGTFGTTFEIPSNDPDTSVATVSASGSANMVLTAIAGYKQTKLNWTTVGGTETVDSYNLYLSAPNDDTVWTTVVISSTESSYIHANLTVGDIYYYRVSANILGAEKYESDVLSVEVKNALLVSDFDDNTLQGWTPGKSSFTVFDWDVVEIAPGMYAVTDTPGTNYGLNYDMWLSSPVIDLTGTTAPTLSYWRKLETEPGYDFCKTEISTNGGVSFSLLRQISGNYPTFEKVTIDLSPYKAFNQVVIRFRLTSNGSTNMDGCYIDDVVVTQ